MRYYLTLFLLWCSLSRADIFDSAWSCMIPGQGIFLGATLYKAPGAHAITLTFTTGNTLVLNPGDPTVTKNQAPFFLNTMESVSYGADGKLGLQWQIKGSHPLVGNAMSDYPSNWNLGHTVPTDKTTRYAGFSSRIGTVLATDQPQWWNYDTENRAEAQDAYWQVYTPANATPFSWTGNVAQLVSGTVDQTWRTAYVTTLNYCRYGAWAPVGRFHYVTETADTVRQQEDQDAALVYAANQKLSHQIDSTWIDYSESARIGASTSNAGLAIGYKVPFSPNPLGYLADEGDNNTVVGHRRGILALPGDLMAVGQAWSAPTLTCSNTLYLGTLSGDRIRSGDPFDTALVYPSRGFVSVPELNDFVLIPSSYLRLSVSFAREDAVPHMDNATAQVTMGGQNVPVTSTLVDGDTVIITVKHPSWLTSVANDIPCHVVINGISFTDATNPYWSLGPIPDAARSPRTFAWDFTIYDPTVVAAATYTTSSTISALSTRATIGSGDSVLIAGFIIGGNEPIKVAIRTQGPGLAQYGVTGTTTHPAIEIHQTVAGKDSILGTNSGWKTGANWRMVQSYGLNPSDVREGVAICNLNPGNYTAIVSDPTGGVGIVEIYAVDGQSASTLTAVSTRGIVGVSNTAMIAGIIVQQPTTMVIRAQGPGLAKYGVTGVVTGTTLHLVRQSDGATLATNSGWDVPNNARLKTDLAYMQPSDPREAAWVVTLPAGAYTAVVEASDGHPGVGIVEAFQVN